MSPRRPKTQRLERNHFLGRDVAEVDLGPELLHEPGLSRLRRRLEDHVLGSDRGGDLADQLRPHPATGVEDPSGTALARLGDHLPRARGQLLPEPAGPLGGAVLDRRVLRADLGEHGEVAGEVGDELELALARDLDGAVRDLDVGKAKLAEPALVVVEPVLDVDDLEEGAAEDDGLLLQHVQLPPQVRRDVRRAPAELDDVDQVAGHLEHVLPPAGAEALVDHVRQPGSGAAGARGQSRAKSSFSFSWAAVWTSW